MSISDPTGWEHAIAQASAAIAEASCEICGGAKGKTEHLDLLDYTARICVPCKVKHASSLRAEAIARLGVLREIMRVDMKKAVAARRETKTATAQTEREKMPTATENDIRRWNARVTEIRTKGELSGLIEEIAEFDLPDHEPANDQGSQKPSIRCQAAGLVAAAAANMMLTIAAKEALPGGRPLYLSTRMGPACGHHMRLAGLIGEDIVIVPVKAMASRSGDYYFSGPGISLGHYTAVEAEARKRLAQIAAIQRPHQDAAEEARLVAETDKLNGILVGDLPGPWRIMSIQALTSAGVKVL